MQESSNHNSGLLNKCDSCDFVCACEAHVKPAFRMAQIRAMAVSDDGQLIYVAEAYLARRDVDEDQVDI